MFDKNIVRVEVFELYDGWIAEYNTETKELILRDIPVVQGLSDKMKLDLIRDIKKSMG